MSSLSPNISCRTTTPGHGPSPVGGTARWASSPSISISGIRGLLPARGDSVPMVMLERLAVPIVQAPLAGGPSTPELAAAVADAGALGFVAAGYRTPDAFAADLAATRAPTDGLLGANLFAPGGAPADPAVVAAYAERLAPEAARAGVQLGAPRFDDDAFDAKLAVLAAHPVDVVSFTFAAPPADAVAAVHATGAAVWVTVTHP